jgi:hypothetical protein
MVEVSSAIINLNLVIHNYNLTFMKFYWRPTLDNDIIEYCVNLPNNCRGGKIPGDISCAEGHSGALCESCDLTGAIWGVYLLKCY